MISIDNNATYIEHMSTLPEDHKASAVLDFSGVNPSDGDTITFNGTVFTFKDSTANATDVQIGADISTTLDNLLANTSLPTDVIYRKVDTDKIFIEYKTASDSGNNWLIDCSFANLPTGLSGAEYLNTDWVKATNTTLSAYTRMIPLASDTTDSSLNSFRSFSAVAGSKFVEGARVLVIDSANNIEPLTLGAITTSGSYGTWDSAHIGSKITLDSSTNLIATRSSDSDSNVNAQVYGFQITEGNIYWEVVGGSDETGISTDNTYQDGQFGNTGGYGYGNNGYLYHGSSNSKSAYGDSYTSTDVIGVRYCYETGELEFYKNGVSQGVIATSFDSTTNVYPALGLYNARTTATLTTSEADLKYLPEDCRPLGDFEFKAAISASKTPVKAFFDDEIYVGIDIEPTSERLVNTPLEPLRIFSETADSGSNLVTLAPVAEGEEIIVNSVEAPAGSVTAGDSTVGILDILGDGSCVATYTFDDSTANDLSGNYDGTIKGNIGFTGGLFGKGVTCTSVSTDSGANQVELTTDEFNSDAFTLSMFFKVNSVNDSNNNILLSNYNTSDQVFFEIGYQYNNNLYVGYCDRSLGSIPYMNTYINYSKFVHFVFIVDKNKNKNTLYVDGKLVGSVIASNISGNLSQAPRLFDWVSGSNRINADAVIDQVRVFNKALTEAEIQALYYEQKQTIELSNHGLTSKPYSAFKKQGIDVIIDSSTTTQITGHVYANVLIDSGDNVILDNSKLVPVTKVVDSITNTVEKLDILGDGSCVATYTFDDGTANDLSGNHDGNWYGTAAYAIGKYGKAASFDGGSWIETDFSLTDESTVSIWVNFNGVDYTDNSDMYRIWNSELGTTDNSTNTGLAVYNNYLIFFANDGNIKKSFELNATDDKWHHIVCDIVKEKMYYDTIEITTNPGQGNTIGTADDDLIIGCCKSCTDGPNQMFNGLIDQVRIFDKALTEDEIQKLYEEQVSRYTISFDSQANAPQSLKIPDRSKTLAPVARTFDGTNFNFTYPDCDMQGRAFQRKIFAAKQGSVILPPMQTAMYKKG